MQSSSVWRLASANAMAPLANNGVLRIYSGGIPDPDAAAPLAGGALLTAHTMAATAFSSVTDDGTNAVMVAGSIASDTAPSNSGVATYFRVFQSDGTTVLGQGTAGTTGSDLVLDNATITAGAGNGVSITSMVLKVPQ